MKDETVNDGQVRSDVNDFLLGSLLGNTNIVSLVYKTTVEMLSMSLIISKSTNTGTGRLIFVSTLIANQLS